MSVVEHRRALTTARTGPWRPADPGSDERGCDRRHDPVAVHGAGGDLRRGVLRLPGRQEHRDVLPGLHDEDLLHGRGPLGRPRATTSRCSSSSVFTTTLVNTALFTAGSIVLQFVIGLGLALFFRRNFPLSGFLRGLLLLPWLLPLIASSAVWKWLLDQDSGALNQFLGVFGIARASRGSSARASRSSP